MGGWVGGYGFVYLTLVVIWCILEFWRWQPGQQCAELENEGKAGPKRGKQSQGSSWDIAEAELAAAIPRGRWRQCSRAPPRRSSTCSTPPPPTWALPPTPHSPPSVPSPGSLAFGGCDEGSITAGWEGRRDPWLRARGLKVGAGRRRAGLKCWPPRPTLRPPGPRNCTPCRPSSLLWARWDCEANLKDLIWIDWENIWIGFQFWVFFRIFLTEFVMCGYGRKPCFFCRCALLAFFRFWSRFRNWTRIRMSECYQYVKVVQDDRARLHGKLLENILHSAMLLDSRGF